MIVGPIERGRALDICDNDPERISDELGHPPCCYAATIADSIWARGKA